MLQVVFKKNGFTLIELLIVVLIIGVLAAVALPQYQKAVEKSRLSGAISTVSTMQKAIDIWLLENDWPSGEDSVIFLGSPKDSAYQKGVLDLGFPLICNGDDFACRDSNFLYWSGCNRARCSITFARCPAGICINDGENELYGYSIRIRNGSNDRWQIYDGGVSNPNYAYIEDIVSSFWSWEK